MPTRLTRPMYVGFHKKKRGWTDWIIFVVVAFTIFLALLTFSLNVETLPNGKWKIHFGKYAWGLDTSLPEEGFFTPNSDGRLPPQNNINMTKINLVLKTESGHIVWVTTFLVQAREKWWTQDTSVNLFQPRTSLQVDCKIVRCQFMSGIIHPTILNSIRHGGWDADKEEIWIGDDKN